MPRLPDPPPAAILLSWVVEGRTALVVGGGSVSTRRVRTLLSGYADVVVVAPGVSSALSSLAEAGEITLHRRRWHPTDLEDVDLVMVAVDEPGVSATISLAARALGVPVHVADDPPLCDFYFPATARDGPVRVAVSTGGAGPALAGRLRSLLAAALPADTGEAVRRFGLLRASVRRALPQARWSRARMQALTRVARETPWPTLSSLDDQAIAALTRRVVAAASGDPAG